VYDSRPPLSLVFIIGNTTVAAAVAIYNCGCTEE
jgi:hypothetical protein